MKRETLIFVLSSFFIIISMLILTATVYGVITLIKARDKAYIEEFKEQIIEVKDEEEEEGCHSSICECR